MALLDFWSTVGLWEFVNLLHDIQKETSAVVFSKINTDLIKSVDETSASLLVVGCEYFSEEDFDARPESKK